MATKKSPAPAVLSTGPDTDLMQSIFRKINSDARKRGLPADMTAVGFARDLEDKKRLPTGNPILDYLMNGGWKVGNSNELYGPPGGGKTSLCIESVVAVTTDKDDPGYALWLQAEEGDIKEQLQLMGANMDRVIVQPVRGSGQLAFQYMTEFLMEDRARKINLKLIVMDSLAGLTPKSMIERTEKDGRADAGVGIGEVARMFADWYRDMHSQKLGEHIVLLLINQIRTKMNAYGASEDSYSGFATKHGPRTRIKIRAGEALFSGTGDNKRQIGHKVKLKIVKDGSTHIRQGTEAEFDVIYGHGNDREASYFFLLKEFGAYDILTGGRYNATEEFLKFLSPEDQELYKSIHGEPKFKAALKTSPTFSEAARRFVLTRSMKDVGEKEIEPNTLEESEEDLSSEDAEVETV